MAYNAAADRTSEGIIRFEVGFSNYADPRGYPRVVVAWIDRAETWEGLAAGAEVARPRGKGSATAPVGAPAARRTSRSTGKSSG